MKSYEDNFATLYTADAKRVGEFVPERSVHCCVTSPPYFGLRSYLPAEHPDKGAEIGSETTPEAFVQNLVEIFREVWKVLRDDGTLWVNIGDSYARMSGGMTSTAPKNTGQNRVDLAGGYRRGNLRPPTGMKEKDLMGIPWMLAFALRADGWYLRSDVIWAKDAVMPESVTDRPTRSHEHLFLLTKKPRYFYDAEAIREPSVSPQQEAHQQRYAREYEAQFDSAEHRQPGNVNSKGIHSRPGSGGRNRRDVWRINPVPFSGAHFAAFPPALVEPCIKAGTSEYGVCGEVACGAPWVRVVERRANPSGITGGTHREPGRPEGYMNGRPRDYEAEASIGSTKTVGWEPTCSCVGADTVPATVLDPFAGSGTTLYVARSLGRRSVGLDLDERSAGLLEQRMGLQGVML